MSGIFAKTIDFLFRTFYIRQLGSEGAGLLSLAFSAHSIMLTLSSAGISVAVSKIVSAHFAKGNVFMARKSLITSMKMTFFASLVLCTFLLFSKSFIANNILKDKRCESLILCLAPSVVFMGLSYCLKGYFYSTRRIFPPASSEFLEQAVKITSITTLLRLLLPRGCEAGVMAVTIGYSLGECSSFLYLFLFCLKDFKAPAKKESSSSAVLPILKIALPALFASLLGSYFHMQEELLMISGLKKRGFTHSGALSAFGGISGMLIPLALFPLSLMSSFFSLLVPEISRAAERRTNTRLKDLSKKVYKFSHIGAFGILTIFFSALNEIPKLFYGLEGAGSQLLILSLLLPLIMCDSLSGGILNGTGKQSFLLFVTISECSLRLIICFLLVPRLGISAIFIVFYAGVFLSFFLRCTYALSLTGIRFRTFEWFLCPFFLALFSAFFSGKILSFLINNSFWVKIIIGEVIYISLCLISGLIKKEEILWFKERLTPGR